MKYFSIDIETTGLSPDEDQIIEFAAVFDDLTEPKPLDRLPVYQRIIDPGRIVGNPFALNMNARIIKMLSKIPSARNYDWCYTKALAMDFAVWCREFEANATPSINVAGKNFANFDQRFLEQIPDWGRHVKIRHRIIDPSFAFLQASDESMPNLDTCLSRAGLKSYGDRHKAVDDAMDVIQLVRSAFL